MFLDRAYVHLDVEGNCYTVTIRSKEQLDDHYDYENEFENELLAQQARKIVSVKTKNIRELIAARALSSTIVQLRRRIRGRGIGL